MKKYAYVLIHHNDKLRHIEKNNLERIYKNIKAEIYFILPNKCRYSDLIFQFPQIQFIFIDNKYLSNSKAYNKYLVNPMFYKLFVNYEYIILYQLDTWQINFNHEKFLENEYDFIGAPFISEDRHNGIKFANGRNGGVSVRKIHSCLKILSQKNILFSLNNVFKIIGYGNKLKRPLKTLFKKYFSFIFLYSVDRKIWMWHLNEDIFWSVIVPQKFPWFKISDLATSLNFCFDQEPEFCYEHNKNELPTFVHAIEKYDFKFYSSKIEDLNSY